MRILGLALIAATVSGCGSVPATPPDVYSAASSALSPNCLALFAGEGYQKSAQGTIYPAPIFAISISEDRKYMLCTYSAQTYQQTIWEENRVTALNRCESAKPDWAHTYKVPFGKCTVYAEGNTIVSNRQE